MGFEADIPLMHMPMDHIRKELPGLLLIQCATCVLAGHAN
jgi:hypothetical protein